MSTENGWPARSFRCFPPDKRSMSAWSSARSATMKSFPSSETCGQHRRRRPGIRQPMTEQTIRARQRLRWMLGVVCWMLSVGSDTNPEAPPHTSPGIRTSQRIGKGKLGTGKLRQGAIRKSQDHRLESGRWPMFLFLCPLFSNRESEDEDDGRAVSWAPKRALK